MTTEETRRASALSLLDEPKLDALLVTNLHNVRYLTGFTGSSGLALLHATDGAGARSAVGTFLTDFRYEAQSAEQVAEEFDREIVVGSLLDAAAGGLAGETGTLGFDEASLTVAQHERLRSVLASGWICIRWRFT